jgi:hypothetical protein
MEFSMGPTEFPDFNVYDGESVVTPRTAFYIWSALTLEIDVCRDGLASNDYDFFDWLPDFARKLHGEDQRWLTHLLDEADDLARRFAAGDGDSRVLVRNMAQQVFAAHAMTLVSELEGDGALASPEAVGLTLPSLEHDFDAPRRRFGGASSSCSCAPSR